jgi:hypothetical protein
MGAFVRNERTKLTATYLNGLAIAILAVGALAPVIMRFDFGCTTFGS